MRLMRKETYVLLPIYPRPYIAGLVECYKAHCTYIVAPLFCDKQDVSKPAGFDLALKIA